MHLRPEPPGHFRKGAPPEAPVDAVAPVASDAEQTTATGRALLCAACGHPITSTAARISVDGHHEHSAVNPHGYSYRFGCFARAPGCASRGVPSAQYTWFPGHHWQVQECARCGEHLGWLFFSSQREFYGLILDALIEAEGEAGPS
jgi:hypothetical protein